MVVDVAIPPAVAAVVSYCAAMCASMIIIIANQSVAIFAPPNFWFSVNSIKQDGSLAVRLEL